VFDASLFFYILLGSTKYFFSKLKTVFHPDSIKLKNAHTQENLLSCYQFLLLSIYDCIFYLLFIMLSYLSKVIFPITSSCEINIRIGGFGKWWAAIGDHRELLINDL
jgi:hypothetical protein